MFLGGGSFAVDDSVGTGPGHCSAEPVMNIVDQQANDKHQDYQNPHPLQSTHVHIVLVSAFCLVNFTRGWFELCRGVVVLFWSSLRTAGGPADIPVGSFPGCSCS